jgi:hypothetical protein
MNEIFGRRFLIETDLDDRTKWVATVLETIANNEGPNPDHSITAASVAYDLRSGHMTADEAMAVINGESPYDEPSSDIEVAAGQILDSAYAEAARFRPENMPETARRLGEASLALDDIKLAPGL